MEHLNEKKQMDEVHAKYSDLVDAINKSPIPTMPLTVSFAGLLIMGATRTKKDALEALDAIAKTINEGNAPKDVLKEWEKHGG